MSVVTVTIDRKRTVSGWKTQNGVLSGTGGISGWDYKSSTGEKRSKPKGFLAPTAYTVTFRSGMWTACSNAYGASRNTSNGIMRTTGGYNTFNSQWSNFTGGLGSIDPKAANKAIINARKNIKGQKVNFAVAFGERKQTAALFVSTVKKVSAVIDACRERNPRAIKKALGLQSKKVTRREKAILRTYGRSPKGQADKAKAASNLWLENAYGLQPALSDLKGSAELLAERDLADPKRYTYAAKGFATIKSSAVTKGLAYQDFLGTTLAYLTYNVRRTSKAMTRIDCYLTNPALAQAANLGLTNPASFVWERTPWSYVIDWVLPIGDYLNTMDATLGWTFKSGSTSQKYEVTCHTVATPHTPQSGYDRIASSGSGKMTYGTLNRAVHSSFPLPASIVPKNPLSTGHVANALALLLQRR